MSIGLDEKPHTLTKPAESSCLLKGTPAAMRLAYLTTAYPEVSHTFVRREILELEERGHHVIRLSIRPASSTLVDPVDIQEANQTFYCLAQPALKLTSIALATAIRRPLRFFKACRMTMDMAKCSDRGLLRHLAYLVEALNLLPQLQRQQVQHVHAHFGTNSAAVARLLYCLGGPSYSMTIHGPGEFDAAIGFSLGPKISDAAFVVAITDFCAAQLWRWVDYPQWPKIQVVGCVVGEEFFQHARPIDRESKTLVCVGRLSAQKGQLLLLDAFAEMVHKHRIPAKLVLAGDGEMRQLIERHIAERGLQHCVEITGWVSAQQVRQLLLGARALVLPSFAEGLPVVIMESMAMQRPVLSTYIAGIPELVRPGENGWLVPAGSVDTLVDALIQIMTTPIDNLNEMGRCGQSLVRSRHDTTTEAIKLERLFRQAIDNDTG